MRLVGAIANTRGRRGPSSSGSATSPAQWVVGAQGTYLVAICVAGEVPFAAPTYHYKASRNEEGRRQPIEWYVLAPGFARVHRHRRYAGRQAPRRMRTSC